MKDGRLGLRVEASLLKEVRVYASKRNITVSSLVQKYLEELIEADRRARSTSETLDAPQV